MPKAVKAELTIKMCAVVPEGGNLDGGTLAMGGFLKALSRFRTNVMEGEFQEFNVEQSHFGSTEDEKSESIVTIAHVLDVGESERDISLTNDERDALVRACVKGTHAEPHVESVIQQRIANEKAAAH